MTFIFILCVPLIYFFFPQFMNQNLDGLVPVTLQIPLFSLTLFLFFYYAYVHVYGLFEFSISIRILVHLLESRNRSLSFDEIREIYPFEEVLNRKIDAALSQGLVKENSVESKKILLNTKPWNVVGFFANGVKKFLQWGAGG